MAAPLATVLDAGAHTGGPYHVQDLVELSSCGLAVDGAENTERLIMLSTECDWFYASEAFDAQRQLSSNCHIAVDSAPSDLNHGVDWLYDCHAYRGDFKCCSAPASGAVSPTTGLELGVHAVSSRTTAEVEAPLVEIDRKQPQQLQQGEALLSPQRERRQSF